MMPNNRIHPTSPTASLWVKREMEDVKLTARGARDQLNVAYASPSPWPGGPLRAPPNHCNGADCGGAIRKRTHA
jgi:hypothetical protein